MIDTDASPSPTRLTPVQRIAASISDPVLRVLVLSTLIGRVGRGIFLTVTVLYFTLIVGLSALEVALVLAASSAVGVVASLVGGQLADRFSARRLLLGFSALSGLGLISYVFADSFPTALLIACVVGAADSAGNATRMAIIARAFTGAARVNARAVLRTVTNIAIAAGSALGGLALLVGTADAYRGILVGAGVIYLLGCTVLVRLPSGVDAPPREVGVDTSARAAITADRRRRSPWRNPRYLALSALSAIFGIQFGLAEVGVPLWIAHDTSAPTALVSVVLILNTIVVIIFQVPLSRGTHDLRRAGAVTAWAGVIMAAACLLYFAASGTGVVAAVILLLVAALAHACAEVLSQAGGWGLSFELADPAVPGAYQGVFSMAFSVGSMLAPLVVTAALAQGFVGWAGLAVMFLLAAFGTAAIARRAARARRAEDLPAS
ncbi:MULTISPECIES: MFS transporter [unclassified Leifsonia]|uniref:MFS transporter n=1 Tax=unclassified Leifsonia TaxID=2663824 RepID=UPI001F15DE11|nr:MULTISPECIES: MFS transporter [unclassified Leifsonia]